jgi:hypothetical protein
VEHDPHVGFGANGVDKWGVLPRAVRPPASDGSEGCVDPACSHGRLSSERERELRSFQVVSAVRLHCNRRRNAFLFPRLYQSIDDGIDRISVLPGKVRSGSGHVEDLARECGYTVTVQDDPVVDVLLRIGLKDQSRARKLSALSCSTRYRDHNPCR